MQNTASEIFFNTRIRSGQATMSCLFYDINTNEIANHFTLTLFLAAKGAIYFVTIAMAVTTILTTGLLLFL